MQATVSVRLPYRIQLTGIAQLLVSLAWANHGDQDMCGSMSLMSGDTTDTNNVLNRGTIFCHMKSVEKSFNNSNKFNVKFAFCLSSFTDQHRMNISLSVDIFPAQTICRFESYVVIYHTCIHCTVYLNITL